MKDRRAPEASAIQPGASPEEARNYEEHSLKVLRNEGYRITMPRVQVIRALADTSRALSAYAIHEKILSGGGKIDVVSVYRILSTLQEIGLIHHIGIVDGYFPCRMTDCNGKRSLVVVNEGSGTVFELRMPAEVVRLLEAEAASAGFKSTAIKIEVSGSSH